MFPPEANSFISHQTPLWKDLSPEGITKSSSTQLSMKFQMLISIKYKNGTNLHQYAAIT